MENNIILYQTEKGNVNINVKYENENFHDAARVMYDARTNLTSIMTAASGGRAITPSISMIDLTFPGGTFGD